MTASKTERKLFVRYRFLFRLISVGLLMMLILSLSSTYYVSRRSYSTLQESTKETVERFAESIANTMQDYLVLFKSIGRSCLETPYTFENSLNSYKMMDSAQQDSSFNPATELLKGFALSMPILSGLSIYYHNSENMLYAHYSGFTQWSTLIGTLPAPAYLQIYYPELNASSLIDQLDNQREGIFWTDETLLDTNRMLYLLPVSIVPTSPNRRAILFEVTQETLMKIFSTLLGDLYSIAEISYNGNVIYRTAGEEGDRLFLHDNSNGFSVTLRMSAATYATLFTPYSAATIRFGLVSILLCTVFVVFFIVLTYVPVNNLVRSIDKERSSDELSTITHYISRKEQTELLLREELDKEKQHIRYQHLDMLLLGIPLLNGEKPLDTKENYHLAAVSLLDHFEDINRAISLLEGTGRILAYEQFRTNQLIMLVSSDDADGMAAQFEAFFKKTFGDIPMGVGSICDDVSHLHHSFLDAMMNLRRNTQTDLRSDNGTDAASFDLMKAQLIANDISCIETAKAMFDRLESQASSYVNYRYNYCQLIEKIGSLLQQYGYPIDIAQYLMYMSEADIRMSYSRFLDTLKDLLTEGPQDETPSEKEYGQSIIDYIGDNISNEAFSIIDLTECFNLSEYTVTKLIRDKTNTTFKRYLTQLRLEHARILLSTTIASIQDIAVQCGFSSSSYFIRVFKTEVGITPLQYRNSQQE